ncbi:MAG: DUF3830 family protein [Candidatus Bathyarchaeia archaeon]
MLRLTIDGYEFEAEMHEKDAPETCRKLKGALPITGQVIQARWSGEAVWLKMDPQDIEVPLENQTSYPGKGELLYYRGGVSEKELLIPYGSARFASKVGLLPGNHFATIIRGTKELSEMGEKVLWNGSQKIRIEIA